MRSTLFLFLFLVLASGDLTAGRQSDGGKAAADLALLAGCAVMTFEVVAYKEPLAYDEEVIQLQCAK